MSDDLLDTARDHVHNWDASPDLEHFVNTHIDELESHVAVVIERITEDKDATIERLERDKAELEINLTERREVVSAVIDENCVLKLKLRQIISLAGGG